MLAARFLSVTKVYMSIVVKCHSLPIWGQLVWRLWVAQFSSVVLYLSAVMSSFAGISYITHYSLENILLIKN